LQKARVSSGLPRLIHTVRQPSLFARALRVTSRLAQGALGTLRREGEDEQVVGRRLRYSDRTKSAIQTDTADVVQRLVALHSKGGGQGSLGFKAMILPYQNDVRHNEGRHKEEQY